MAQDDLVNYPEMVKPYSFYDGDSCLADCADCSRRGYCPVGWDNVRSPRQDHLRLGPKPRSRLLRDPSPVDRPFNWSPSIRAWANFGYPNGDYEAEDRAFLCSGEGM